MAVCVCMPRTAQDDHPALPQGISPLLQDFLLQCFNKVCLGARRVRVHEAVLGAEGCVCFRTCLAARIVCA